jgi:Cdc6-like AAA superfamily ATPase
VIKSEAERHEGLEILNWLTPIDYGHLQSDYLRRRQQGTGEWFLNSPEFQTWFNTAQQTLFCMGIPGAGKTIMTSIVIDHLTRSFPPGSTVGIAYVYCDFRRQHEQTLEHCLASLLKQLAQGLPSVPDTVKDLYSRHRDKRTHPTYDELAIALNSVIMMYSRAFIVVDALDECTIVGGCRPRLLSEISNLQTKAGINIFATSRILGEIAKWFEWTLRLEIRATDDDMRNYLNAQMLLENSDIFDRSIREMVTATVVNAANGM